MEDEILELLGKLDAIDEEIAKGNFEDFEENVLAIEEEVFLLKRAVLNDHDIEGVELLSARIKNLKAEGDFYDEEAELDRMFPDRHDPDFDQDSMSYDSVFGGD